MMLGVLDRRYGHFRRLLRYDHKYIPPTTSLIYPHHSAGATVRAFTRAKMFGRKVDLRTPAELSRYFRDEVLEKARVEYAI